MENIKKHWALFALDGFYFVLAVIMFIGMPKFWYVWLPAIAIAIIAAMIIILRPVAVDLFVRWFRYPLTIECGDSMYFLGIKYQRGEPVECKINDRVIIHPVPGRSQATKSYPGVIRVNIISGRDGHAAGLINVLVVEGIEENKNWGGAWMNEYLFGRLEFVSRSYKD